MDKMWSHESLLRILNNTTDTVEEHDILELIKKGEFTEYLVGQ